MEDQDFIKMSKNVYVPISYAPVTIASKKDEELLGSKERKQGTLIEMLPESKKLIDFGTGDLGLQSPEDNDDAMIVYNISLC